MEDLKIKIRSTIKKYLEINDTEEVELVTLWEGVKAVYIYIYKYIYIIICFIWEEREEQKSQGNRTIIKDMGMGAQGKKTLLICILWMN